MALNPTTPGVYIQEISTLPPSVVAVPTSVPVFIGYTQFGKKATPMSPVRIESLLEFEQIFGGPFVELYTAGVTNTATTVAPTSSFSQYTLYRNLQMFYGNGGGVCYVASVGNYTDSILSAQLMLGIDKAEEADEITLLVIPEAITSTFSDSDIRNVNNKMLSHCAKMQDRFAILDVPIATSTIAGDAANFRDDLVGIDNLKYGASYYPPIKTTFSRPFSLTTTVISDTRTAPIWTDSASGPYNNLFSVLNGKASWARIDVGSIAAGDSLTINGVSFTEGIDFVLATALDGLRNAINNNSTVNSAVVAISAGQAPGIIAVLARNGATASASFIISSANIIVDPAVPGSNAGTPNIIDTELFNSINALLEANKLVLHPSSTMAGIYSRVDNAVGVWKAPANVGVNLLESLTVNVTNQAQGELNVDAAAGKSINALRNFVGRGPLVWGARTLDGNSNEWRYVNVRRLFIMAEESCKKASEFVVFEPNDKNTWNRVKGTIGNFLTSLWRDGALTGDKPEQAFFVKVGLNETMTAQDILEGKMIVEIGMAAVRPAEFIILRFMHKLQES